jgi:hypothetical protein
VTVSTEFWIYTANGNLDTWTNGVGQEWVKFYDDYDRLEKDETPLCPCPHQPPDGA